MSGSSVTVVVPTRNRREEVIATIRSVLASDHPDTRVAVFDNCSTDGTASALRETFGTRVVVRRSLIPLAMVESFEHAYEMVETEWVLGVGADDGLHPRAISRMLILAEEHGVRAVTPLRAGYRWPDASEGTGGELRIPPLRPDRVVSSREAVRRVLSGRMKWYFLPSGYTGLLDATILDELRKRNGRVFTSVTPDLGMNFSVARELDWYVVCGEPLYVSGTSKSSNGASHFGSGDPAVAREFWNLTSQASVPLHPQMTAVQAQLPPSIRVIALEAFLQAGGPIGLRETVLTAPLVQAWLAWGSRAEPDLWWRGWEALNLQHTGTRILWRAAIRMKRLWAMTLTLRQYGRAALGRILGVFGLHLRRPTPKNAYIEKDVPTLGEAIALLERRAWRASVG